MPVPGSAVLLSGARTPFGKFLGSLSSQTADQLGTTAIAGALARAGLTGTQIDQVIMGQVLSAGAGQLPARQAAVAAGIPMTSPALSINRMCLSGIDAVTLAAQVIACGDADTVIAGGQESMSNAPHLLSRLRRGHKYGQVPLIDHLEFDGLEDAYTRKSMGALADSQNAQYRVERTEQDTFAYRSHTNAAAAAKSGVMDTEIVPVITQHAGSDMVIVDRDEGIRPDTTTAALGRLRPAFDASGSITAGNSSPLSDGACAVVVMNRAKAESEDLPWIAEIRSGAIVAGPDSGLHHQPARAIQKACEREGISPSELDLVEINEAFAAVGIASVRKLNIDPSVVNVNGGAIALGHPIGTSGARIVLHLALELARRGGGTGAASLCGGGGQGQALILRVPNPKRKQ